MKLTLIPYEVAVLFRQDPATRDDGGFQRLLITLQELTDQQAGEITFPERLRERIARYAFDYGNGGWEDRLTAIFARTLGPRLGR